MISLLIFKILILLLLFVGAYTDYKTRIVSNKIIVGIVILSLPIILEQTNWLIPILLVSLFLGMFYFPFDKIGLPNQIGGADTKVLIPLMLGMSTNEIFIFFLLFTIPNIYFLIRFWKGIPLFIPILFGYSGVILLSLLPILIHMTFGY